MNTFTCSNPAISALDHAAKEWQAAKNRRTLSELSGSLPDGYWKEEWAARQRFLAAKSIAEAFEAFEAFEE